MDNREWSEKVLLKFDGNFRHRWVLFDELVTNSLNKEIVWFDCGAGNNESVYRFNHLSKFAIGLDILKPLYCNNFIISRIEHLPFKLNSTDLITLRFVVEHFVDPYAHLSELGRVLRPGGKIIILTTNILSPFIFLPKLFLPQSLKAKLLTKIFKVNDEDVFPTFHKLNSLCAIKKHSKKFIVERIQFISDLNYKRKWMFIILLGWHLVTRPKILNKFRTNLLVVLNKH